MHLKTKKGHQHLSASISVQAWVNSHKRASVLRACLFLLHLLPIDSLIGVRTRLWMSIPQTKSPPPSLPLGGRLVYKKKVVFILLTFLTIYKDSRKDSKISCIIEPQWKRKRKKERACAREREIKRERET